MNEVVVPALTPISPVSFARIPKLPISPSVLTDESRFTEGLAVCVCQPRTVEEVAGVLQEATLQKIPVRIAGARTGVAGGCIPESELVIDMGAMKKMGPFEIDPASREQTLWAEAGVSLRDIQNYVADISHHTYFYPPDPTEATASLGGTIATNASGARTYRYGPTRNWIESIEVVLASGVLLRLKRGQYLLPPSVSTVRFTTPDDTTTILLPIGRYPWPTVKHTGGFYSNPDKLDLIDLFIGSEGLLGVLAAAEIKVIPSVPSFSVVQFTPTEEKAFEFVQALDQDELIRPEFIEFYDGRSLEFLKKNASPLPVPIPPKANSAVFFNIPLEETSEVLEETKLLRVFELAEKTGIGDARSMVAMDADRKEALDELRHLLPETINRVIAKRKRKVPEIHKISTDFSVPAHHFASFWQLCKYTLSEAGLEWVSFGHIGNAHLHINILPDTLQSLQTAKRLYITLAQEAVAQGGSISAEHGIGRVKRHLFPVQFSAEAISQMKEMKKALDPQLLLNPNTLW